MILDTEIWAKNKGFNCFYVSCYDDVVEFYKKCGYEVDEEDDLTDDFTTLKKEI